MVSTAYRWLTCQLTPTLFTAHHPPRWVVSFQPRFAATFSIRDWDELPVTPFQLTSAWPGVSSPARWIAHHDAFVPLPSVLRSATTGPALAYRHLGLSAALAATAAHHPVACDVSSHTSVVQLPSSEPGMGSGRRLPSIHSGQAGVSYDRKLTSSLCRLARDWTAPSASAVWQSSSPMSTVLPGE